MKHINKVLMESFFDARWCLRVGLAVGLLVVGATVGLRVGAAAQQG
jgi:hypothetical protein